MSVVSASASRRARLVTCDPGAHGCDGRSGRDRGRRRSSSTGAASAYVGPRAGAAARACRSRSWATASSRRAWSTRTRTPRWAGSRHAEYAARMAGGDYRAIAAGGRRHPGDAPRRRRGDRGRAGRRARRRACAAWRRLGVTTVEVKSGYGLERGARAQAARRDRARGRRGAMFPPSCRRSSRFTRLPPGETDRDGVRDARGARARAGDRARAPRAVRRRLRRRRRVHRRRRRASSGDAARAAGSACGCTSGSSPTSAARSWRRSSAPRRADHLEHVSDAGIAALARAGVAAVLLPVASFTLGQAPPPVARSARRGGAAGRRERREPGHGADREPSARDGARRPDVRPVARRGDPRSHASRSGRARPRRPGRPSRRSARGSRRSGTSRTSTQSCSPGECARRASCSSRGRALFALPARPDLAAPPSGHPAMRRAGDTDSSSPSQTTCDWRGSRCEGAASRPAAQRAGARRRGWPRRATDSRCLRPARSSAAATWASCRGAC